MNRNELQKCCFISANLNNKKPSPFLLNAFTSLAFRCTLSQTPFHAKIHAKINCKAKRGKPKQNPFMTTFYIKHHTNQIKLKLNKINHMHITKCRTALMHSIKSKK